MAMRPADKNKTTFQRLIDTVLMGLNFEVCLAYLDDIIVFSRDLDSHFDRLEILFRRLREAQLKLKPSQCQMLRKQVSFLGYTVSQAGVGTDPDKVAAVKEWPVPQNLHKSHASIIDGLYRTFPTSPRRSMPLQRRAPGSSGPPTANRPLTN